MQIQRCLTFSNFKTEHLEDCAALVEVCALWVLFFNKSFFFKSTTFQYVWGLREARTQQSCGDRSNEAEQLIINDFSCGSTYRPPSTKTGSNSLMCAHITVCTQTCSVERTGWFTKWHLSTHGVHTHTELSITHTRPADRRYTNTAACLSWKRRLNTEISLWCRHLDQDSTNKNNTVMAAKQRVCMLKTISKQVRDK